MGRKQRWAYKKAMNQRMHVSRRVEFIEVVSRSRRPRDPYRYADQQTDPNPGC